MTDIFADMLAGQMRILGYEGTREYKFHPARKWRVDLAYPGQQIAVEVNGGVWMRGGKGGRHNTGAGYTKDLEKLNALALCGYRVLQFTPAQVEDGTAAQTVTMALIQDAALSGTL